MIRLRALEPADRDRLLEWRNRPEIARYMYTDHVIGPEEHSRWFETAMVSEDRKYWIIELDDEPVGLANLYDIDRQHRRCYWAFYLASPSVRGRGVGSFVEYYVLSHVFDELGLNKLCCEVLGFNEAVVGMHESFGFSREGLFREHIIKGGEAHDVVALAMLADEWEGLREPTRRRLADKGLLPEETP